MTEAAAAAAAPLEHVDIVRLKRGVPDSAPVHGDVVGIHYVGSLTSDGTKFDSTRSKKRLFRFTVGEGLVIPGLDSAIRWIEHGERCIVTMPPAMAYGVHGAGGVIPQNGELQFDIELLMINGKWLRRFYVERLLRGVRQRARDWKQPPRARERLRVWGLAGEEAESPAGLRRRAPDRPINMKLYAPRDDEDEDAIDLSKQFGPQLDYEIDQFGYEAMLIANHPVRRAWRPVKAKAVRNAKRVRYGYWWAMHRAGLRPWVEPPAIVAPPKSVAAAARWKKLRMAVRVLGAFKLAEMAGRAEKAKPLTRWGKVKRRLPKRVVRGLDRVGRLVAKPAAKSKASGAAQTEQKAPEKAEGTEDTPTPIEERSGRSDISSDSWVSDESASSDTAKRRPQSGKKQATGKKKQRGNKVAASDSDSSDSGSGQEAEPTPVKPAAEPEEPKKRRTFFGKKAGKKQVLGRSTGEVLGSAW